MESRFARMAAGVRWGVALGGLVAMCCVSRPAAAEGHYTDATGRPVPFESTYDSWFGARRYTPQYGRALGENSILMGLELFLYWWDPRENVTDWQFPDLQTKLTSNLQVRFDDNMFRTNMLFHPFAGGMHYAFTRVNGFGVVPSFAAAAASSTVYEFVFEWREIVSINDLIVTPFAGMAAGEFFHQLGDYLHSRSPRPRRLDAFVGGASLGRRVAAGVLGFPRSLQPAEGRRPVDLEDDSLGYSSAYHHDFRVVAGADLISNDRGDVGAVGVAQIGADIVAMPGFWRPGEFSTWYGEGNFTSMRTRLAMDSSLRDADVAFETHLFGYYSQRLERRKGGLYGSAHEIAGETSLRYVDRWLLGRRDHYATLELLGPTATYWLAAGPLGLKLTGTVAPIFAEVASLAYPLWVDDRGGFGTKSSLLKHGYYHAVGGTGRIGAKLTAHAAVLELNARYARFESVDGQERFFEKVTREPHMSDDALELQTSMGYEPPDSFYAARVHLVHLARKSRMPPFEHERYDQRMGASLEVRF